MLKHVLAFFVFIVVSLAPVSADEGYIPFFPDFLEPDGIGFKGTATINTMHCWADYGGPFYEDIPNPQKCGNNVPEGTTVARGENAVRSSPVSLEYRKNYIFKKLFYTQTFIDFGQTLANQNIKKYEKGGKTKHNYLLSEINTEPFLKSFLTAQEKEKLSLLDSNRIFDLKTESSFILAGIGIGLDLWFLEFSLTPFLMYHQTSITLRSCKYVNINMRSSGTPLLPGGLLGDVELFQSNNGILTPSDCSFYPEKIVTLDKRNYSGLGVGTRGTLSIVFLQTENWRISFEQGANVVQNIWDSDFYEVNYRGLDYYPVYVFRSGLGCGGATYNVGGWDREMQEIDCRNSKGEDMSKKNDNTGGLQITYFFR